MPDGDAEDSERVRTVRSSMAIFAPFEPDVPFTLVQMLALVGRMDQMQAFTWEGKPHAHVPGGVGAHQRYRTVQANLRIHFQHRHAVKREGPVVVGLCFWVPDNRSRDVDNMAKHVLDSAKGALYADDRQVTSLVVLSQLDRSYPRTTLVIAPDHTTTLAR